MGRTGPEPPGAEAETVAAAATAAAETHELLATLAFADDRFADARTELEAAFREWRAAGVPTRAARAAATLADLHANTLGNVAAGNGWLGRARRIVDDLGPCVEVGYVELAYMGCERPDADDLLAAADRALAVAVEFGDPNLEVRALADGGLALITQGRVRAGFSRLDEALAMITAGEVDDLVAVGKSFCSLLSSCDRAGDVARAEEWSRLVQESVLDPLDGKPRVLHTHCRAAYGSLLSRAGRWPEAEAAMLEVLGPEGSTSLGHRADTTANLAALRVEQGRIDEAAELLAPYEDRVTACAPVARVHLGRGQVDVAAAVLRRGIKELVGDALRGGALLSLLVEAELRLGHLDEAAAAAHRLEVLAAESESAALAAEAALARGRVHAAAGDPTAAIAAFESVAHRLGDEDCPLLCGQARLELAEVLTTTGAEADAVSEARAALATFERLGAVGGRDRALAALRRLGVSGRTRRQPPGELVASLTARECEVLELVRQGLSNAEIAQRLYISPKTAEHHVGRILGKLGVRSRAEAAALAATALPHPATGN